MYLLIFMDFFHTMGFEYFMKKKSYFYALFIRIYFVSLRLKCHANNYVPMYLSEGQQNVIVKLKFSKKVAKI